MVMADRRHVGMDRLESRVVDCSLVLEVEGVVDAAHSVLKLQR